MNFECTMCVNKKKTLFSVFSIYSGVVCIACIKVVESRKLRLCLLINRYLTFVFYRKFELCMYMGHRQNYIHTVRSVGHNFK